VQEWLVTFVAQWHRHGGSGQSPSAAGVDAALADAPPSVSALVPAVYSLLRSAPLSPEHAVAAADGTRALALLWATLAPQELHRSIRPLFVVVADLNNVEFRRCALSRAAVATHADAVFLLDSYQEVVVMYGSLTAAPFPPAQDSQLRTTVSSMRQRRRIVPEVRCVSAAALRPHSHTRCS
jgi:hypothetical protein